MSNHSNPLRNLQRFASSQDRDPCERRHAGKQDVLRIRRRQHNGVGDDVLQYLRRLAERRNRAWREEQAVRTTSTNEQNKKSHHSTFNERSSFMSKQ